jgi:hypothetical protein
MIRLGKIAFPLFDLSFICMWIQCQMAYPWFGSIQAD